MLGCFSKEEERERSFFLDPKTKLLDNQFMVSEGD